MDYAFVLYVAGESPSGKRAERTLRRLCREQWAHGSTIRVVDLSENPRLAEEKGILATPTLVMESFAGQRRVVGDLRDEDLVRKGLGLT